jgi:hypothetical protein
MTSIKRAFAVLDRWFLSSHGRLADEGVSTHGEAALQTAYVAALGKLSTSPVVS